MSAKPPLVVALVAVTTLVVPAFSQSTPGKVTSGSEGVMIDGKPAARQGDKTSDGKIVGGSNNVFINGKPAATVGDGTDCGGTAVTGSRGVFINGRPMARQGDTTTGCPGK